MAASNTPLLSVYGPANAPSIILIHGSTVTSAMWQPQIAALAGEFRVLTFDLPGHGTGASLPFTMERAVAWTHAALSSCGDAPALVVGISLGGYVALACAAHDQRPLAGLVLASTTISFTGPLGAYVRVVGWVLSRVLGEEMQRARLASGMRQKYAPSIATALIDAGLYPRAAGQAFIELAKFNALPALATVACPVLLLNGAADAASRKGEAAFLAAARHGSLETIPGAGHLCNLQQPEQFSNAIRRFAQSVSAKAS